MTYLNLADMFFSKRESSPAKTGYLFKKEGNWIEVSFKEAADRAEKIAAGFASLGIKKGERIALISANRLEWALSDYAALALGAALVPIYPSLLGEQVQYIVNDSGAKILVVADDVQMDKINGVIDKLNTVEHYFVFDARGIRENKPWQPFETLIQKGAESLQGKETYVQDSIKRVRRDDVATVIYTSGTTGEPKGTVLTHNNFLSNLEAVSTLFECFPEDVFLSFLPLSHILERTAGHYFPCYHGASIAYAESIDAVAENMQEINPTLMISVPRLYEKMYGRILETIEAGPPLKRRIFFWAVKTGRAFMKRFMEKEKIPAGLKLRHKLAEKLVFHKLREKVGGRLRYFVSGGAPLAAEIGEFFAAVGLIILEGYGLTETSPGITFNRPESFRFGTVGMPLPGVEVRIAGDGEILTRGDHVMKGYLNKEAETREVIDADGWFHTGDIGFIDERGYLIITDRKKNIIVTSGGKNIAPQPIENSLITSKYIEQAVVIGDKRKFCSAIIVPSEEALRSWAAAGNLEKLDFADLLKHERCVDLISAEIKSLTARFASFEQIKKFVLIAEPFTLEGGELTPTLKVKRRTVEKKYAAEIDRLYENT